MQGSCARAEYVLASWGHGTVGPSISSLLLDASSGTVAQYISKCGHGAVVQGTCILKQTAFAPGRNAAAAGRVKRACSAAKEGQATRHLAAAGGEAECAEMEGYVLVASGGSQANKRGTSK